jgi:hypothetical protein
MVYRVHMPLDSHAVEQHSVFILKQRPDFIGLCSINYAILGAFFTEALDHVVQLLDRKSQNFALRVQTHSASPLPPR